jgi:hypothetical protein
MHKPLRSPWLKTVAEVEEAKMQLKRWECRLAERLEKQARFGEPAVVVLCTQFIVRNSELFIPREATEMGISCTDGTMAVVILAVTRGTGS